MRSLRKNPPDFRYTDKVHSRAEMHPFCIIFRSGTECSKTLPNMFSGDRVGVPDLSVSGDKFDLVEVDPHDPTTTSEPEAPMQSLNQLPMVTNLAGARSA